jgi:hypothetical protein
MKSEAAMTGVIAADLVTAALDDPVLRKEWYRDWPSFRWEQPLFWWFIGCAIILGVGWALILHLAPGKK